MARAGRGKVQGGVWRGDREGCVERVRGGTWREGAGRGCGRAGRGCMEEGLFLSVPHHNLCHLNLDHRHHLSFFEHSYDVHHYKIFIRRSVNSIFNVA